ncbi:hypothetical protein EOD41_13885 [Mucilaginibacter limnophilus]|uniref:Type II toxin-antitoxin system VapB family antitoxin n=1 Tax=Mucilaginibacter limnophilus TaxID=1932778 RepID=A0A437MQW4_9SPHI|nr:type II toxin-antitoxin system VapB family antitoxin [Mucilaginibacter limnophilus]RVU00047.1 hypothetical protein EOD41_13885 [Mucilaginibacter limnophilus]
MKISVDTTLLEEAIKLTGIKDKKELIEKALRLLIAFYEEKKRNEG